MKIKKGILMNNKILKILIIVAHIAVIGMFVIGCDKTPQARYDAMTGEKLPEKIEHLKGAKVEQMRFDVDSFLLRVFRIEMEGHVYYTRACGESSFTHSAACPCHTNSIERK